ncbi:MAG TPA: NAD(+) diphosphatase [Geminicoccaceae bacterium]|nr:NAD(+) diphosphatase [Geminicoccaceae bacterium]
MPHLVNPPPHVYAGSDLDRAAKLRLDAAWLAARRADPATRVLLMAKLEVLVDGGDPPRALLATVAELGGTLPDEALFLGNEGSGCLFAADLGISPPAGRYVDLRSVGATLPAREAGLCAYARGLAFWHARNGYCGVCGAPTRSEQGGHMRRCTACEAQHFPRSDPAVIVLVTHRDRKRGERCLLGRAARFPPGMYSTLAGFVEPGESLEAAVRREVLEEAGLQLFAIDYRSSQPWPFPASLMLGFRARALSDGLTVDPDELVDAGWFTKAELRDPGRRPVKLPNPDSIARHLIEEWLAEYA